MDLREGFIRLESEDTKTGEGRLVPLSREAGDRLRSLPPGLPQTPGLACQWRPMSLIRKALVNACQKAGIEKFTIYDFRHKAINNRRLQRHEHFRIMAATGHKTLTVSKYCNTVTKEEPRALVGGENLTHGHL